MKPVLIGLLAINLISCSEVEKVGSKRETTIEGLSFPLTRLITDSSGRELQVTILGRTSDQITFTRQSDGARFDLPITKLSDTDQAFVQQLPLKTAPQEEPVSSVEEPSSASMDPPYIKNRLTEIERLKERIEVLKSEIAAKVDTPTLKLSRKHEIKELEKEINEIRLDIETYKRNNRLD